MKNSVLIYSGGMDSTVLLHEFQGDIEACLYFDYGSKHSKKEQAVAKRNCEQLGIRLVIINLDFMKKIFTSSIINKDQSVPEGHYEDEAMRSTVVPFRNGIMLSIATGYAEQNELQTVLIANHAGDHAIYPDCRPEFIESMSIAANMGTYKEVFVKAPYEYLSKRDIAIRGKRLDVDFSRSYSCYNGRENHCGVCGTCIERKEALMGFDPTSYEK